MISTSKDLLINWKQTPEENSQEFEAFWEEERQKCKNGITIDGVFINPFLYSINSIFIKCMINCFPNQIIKRGVFIQIKSN